MLVGVSICKLEHRRELKGTSRSMDLPDIRDEPKLPLNSFVHFDSIYENIIMP